MLMLGLGYFNKLIYLYFNPVDAEEDYIAFSSDEELVEALGNMMDDVFRVYIRGMKKNLHDFVYFPTIMRSLLECVGGSS